MLLKKGSNSTLFEYVTPGSMMAVDINVVPGAGGGGDTVFLAAGGKHVPANEFGNASTLSRRHCPRTPLTARSAEHPPYCYYPPAPTTQTTQQPNVCSGRRRLCVGDQRGVRKGGIVLYHENYLSDTAGARAPRRVRVANAGGDAWGGAEG